MTPGLVRGRRWLLPTAAILLLGCCGLLWPSIMQVRDGERWAASANSISHIGRGLYSYHEIYGELPAAVVMDKGGKPLYSWRVVLLPYLEEQALYMKFKLDEPWDSPHNKKLARETPRCYRPALADDNDGPGMTRYQVFVGPGTAFDQPNRNWDDLADIILVVEAAELVPWTKPADLTYDPNMPLPSLGSGLSKPSHFLGYEIGRTPGFSAYFGDGSLRFISSKTDEKTLRSLISK